MRLRVIRAAIITIFLSVGTVGALAGCDKGDEGEGKAAGEEEKATEAEKAEAEPEKEPLEPVPEKIDDVNMAKVEIGRRLYFDPLLSGDDSSVSCASCHQFDEGGADGMRTATGIDGQKGPINTPTVLNSRYNLAQFWDGRAKDLAHQAEGPVSNPVEMGDEWEEAAKNLQGDEWYVKKFDEVYDGKLTKENVTDAIAEYEKTLVTPAPFDAYLRGDEDAISQNAKDGYAAFKEVGCTTCHTGIAVGGSMYQKMGLVKDYFGELDRPLLEVDLGRYNVTENEADKHKLKVPTLRNVELTAPYFHDGSVETLDEAVRKMAHHQLGKELDDDQVADIVAFLKSLTGELPDNASPPEGFERALAEPPEAKEEDPFTRAENGDLEGLPVVGEGAEGEGAEGEESAEAAADKQGATAAE